MIDSQLDIIVDGHINKRDHRVSVAEALRRNAVVGEPGAVLNDGYPNLTSSGRPHEYFAANDILSSGLHNQTVIVRRVVMQVIGIEALGTEGQQRPRVRRQSLISAGRYSHAIRLSLS